MNGAIRPQTVANKCSWHPLLPLPSQFATVELGFYLSATQSARVRQGFIPGAMEQKWFAYFQDNKLFQHRSWTGYCVDVVHFVEQGDGLRATHAFVNRNPEQYSETDDDADRKRITAMVYDLADMAPNGAENPSMPSLELASQPNYLGSIEVVHQVLTPFFEAVYSFNMRPYDDSITTTYQDVLAANIRASAILSGSDSAYTAMPGWHTPQCLGTACIRYFGLDEDYCDGESLQFMVSEGLAAVSNHMRQFFKEYFADDDATWEEEALPRLNAVHQFVTAVMVGTNTALMPGLSLEDLHWNAFSDTEANDETSYEEHADDQVGVTDEGAKTSVVYHPKRDDEGELVNIHVPTEPSSPASWKKAEQIAIFVPGGRCPRSLNGIAVSRWRAPSHTLGWKDVPGVKTDLVEPGIPPLTGKALAAGIVMLEPDGRVWAVCPSNMHGGYKTTFPKGRHEGFESLQITAIKETFEESGLQAEITGFLCDVERSTTVTRYYLGRRVAGRPVDMGWEAQAVMLIPLGKLEYYLTNHNDKPIIRALLESSFLG